MDGLPSRDAKPAIAVAAAAAALFVAGPGGWEPGARAAAYAAALGIALLLFARDALGDRAALAAALLLVAGAAAGWPGPADLRRGALASAAILFLLAAERSPRTRPHPGLLLGGWLFLGASVLPNGIAGTLVVPAVVAGHLLTRPAEARVRFLRTPVHLLGLVVAAGAVAGFLFMARPGTEVEFLARLRGTTVPHPVRILDLPVAWLPFPPLAGAALVWAWRRARKDEAPFARTGLAWVGAAVVVGAICAWREAPASLLPLLVPLAVLVGAWLDFSAERNPLGGAARWGVGGACLLAAVAGAATLLHRDAEPVQAMMADGTEIRVGFWIPAWGYVASGALLLVGAAVGAVRLVLLAAPTRAVLDLVLFTTAGGLLLGLALATG